MKRQPAGELRAADVGRTVLIKGWVGRRRDLGELIFLTVRDRSGAVQVVFDKTRCPAEAVEAAAQARGEDVVAVTGEVAHLQVRVPPAKLAAPFLTPPSTAG